VGGDRGRRAGSWSAHSARRGPVRGDRRRNHRQRSVPRPGDRRRALSPRRTACLLRHSGRLPRADQPLRPQAPPDRPLDAHRRAGVSRCAPRISPLRLCSGAGRAQPRRIRHVVGRSRPREPVGAPDHRHLRAGAPGARAAQRPDARTGIAGAGAWSRHRAGARRARGRPGDGGRVPGPDRARAREPGLDHGGRRPFTAGAPGRRPDAA
jgi:hypothetical protein